MGVVRRFYLLLGPLLLDPFDLIERLTPWELTLPEPWDGLLLWGLFVTGLAIAVLLTYHEQRLASANREPVGEVIAQLKARTVSVGNYTTTAAWAARALAEHLRGIGVRFPSPPRSLDGITVSDAQMRRLMPILNGFSILQLQVVPRAVGNAEALWTANALGLAVLRALEDEQLDGPAMSPLDG